MFKNISNSIYRLFTQYLFFSLSLMAFFITIFISFGINSNNKDFFKSSNSFFNKASKEAFIVVFENSDLHNYKKQLLEYEQFISSLNKFNIDKELYEKNNKGKKFPKVFSLPLVAAPLDPQIKVISFFEFNQNKKQYSLATYNGFIPENEQGLSCTFDYLNSSNLQEGTCYSNSFSLLKNIYKIKYRILTQEQFTKMSSSESNKNEKIFAPQPFPLPNDFQLVIEKQIMFGNFLILGTFGFLLFIISILCVAFFQTKR